MLPISALRPAVQVLGRGQELGLCTPDAGRGCCVDTTGSCVPEVESTHWLPLNSLFLSVRRAVETENSSGGDAETPRPKPRA